MLSSNALPTDSTPVLDESQASKEVRTAASLRKMRWVVLAVGLVGSAVLTAFVFGVIPGIKNAEGLAGTVGVSFGAAFVAAAGIVSWWLWTRVANFRTKSASLTSQGLTVEFVGGSIVRLDWADPKLQFSIVEFPNSRVVTGATLKWGPGGLGHYAFVSRGGAELIKSQAGSRGYKVSTKSSGKPPNLWTTTQVSRG
jgi:hypothetical protein